MSGSNQLLLAVLALDSYNRGYNRQLNVSGVTIGGATLKSMSNSIPHSAEVAAGFFASSYTLSDGSTVISYRALRHYGDMIRIALIIGRINEEGIGVAQD
jgi:hypothetical protein